MHRATGQAMRTSSRGVPVLPMPVSALEQTGSKVARKRKGRAGQRTLCCGAYETICVTSLHIQQQHERRSQACAAASAHVQTDIHRNAMHTDI